MANSIRTFVALAMFSFTMLVAGWAMAQPMVYLPFANGQQVRCVQGNSGSFSHSGNLEYAYDFDMGPGRNDTTNPAYGLAVHSPVSGTIITIQQGVSDFTNNTSSNSANHNGWGNNVLVEVIGNDGLAYRLRFAHLKYGSIPSTLREGGTIGQGALLGRIGQTGYSTSPHLHMQMTQGSTSVRSIRFDFAEGPVATGSYVTSRLEANKFMIDNTGRATMGFPVSGISAAPISGTWSTIAWVNRTLGPNFRTSTSTNAAFSWMFSYYLPPRTNVRLSLYASCTNNSNRERAAVYNVRSTASTTVTRATVDQRTLGTTPAYIAMLTLEGGSRTLTVTVSKTTGSNTLCADGIEVYRH